MANENHGVFITQQATAVSVPVVAESGVPFVIGTAPIQSAESPADVGVPVLCTSWNEAVQKLGYSDEWDKYNLSEFMYSHFKLYGCQPVIFCNLLDPATMKTTVAADDFVVENHKAKLPYEAIVDDSLVVKNSGSVIAKGEDYEAYYSDGKLVIELLSDGASYLSTSLSVAYSAVNPSAVTTNSVAIGMEIIELCLGVLGMVPDLICAPGYSHNATVAAVMASKAAAINGLYEAKALIDVSTDPVDGADEYSKVIAWKNSKNMVDKAEIVCWPMIKLDEMTFHMSTQVAGLMAQVDTNNGGCPYESPSNKSFKCTSMVLADGKEVRLTLAQANILNSGGIVTAFGGMGGIVCWGNYTACYPTNTDVKDFFIPVSRMFAWVGNSEINTFWTKLDNPMNVRLRDSILDTVNIWLAGLVGGGRLLGARAEIIESENPLTDLMGGIIRIHNYLTPPSPAQKIEFILEYDVSYLSALFS